MVVAVVAATALHEVAPAATVVHWPLGQVAQAAPAAAEYWPAAQSTQPATAVAAAALPLPAAQLMHEDWAGAELYWPAWQSVHKPSPAEK